MTFLRRSVSRSGSLSRGEPKSPGAFAHQRRDADKARRVSEGYNSSRWCSLRLNPTDREATLRRLQAAWVGKYRISSVVENRCSVSVRKNERYRDYIA